MSKKKGLSLEEKRERMLDLFQEKAEPLSLKELEKRAPKEKGIIVQSVKDVLKTLTDDDMVLFDKIGTGVYYWSLKSSEVNSKRNRIEKLTSQISATQSEIEQLEEAVKVQSAGKEDTEERRELLQGVAEATEQNAQLDTERLKFRDRDPKVIEELESDTNAYKAAANVWTDNVFQLSSHLRKKYMFDRQRLSALGIPDDIDYVE